MKTLKWNLLQIHDFTLVVFIHCMMWAISKFIKLVAFLNEHIFKSGMFAAWYMKFTIEAYGALIRVDNCIRQEEARYFDFDERSLWRKYKYLWVDQWL